MTQITLPWSVCVPDNAKYGVMRGHMKLTRRYRDAKHAAHLLARAQWRRAPMDGPLRLVVAVYFPDRRRRDLLNLSKLLHDALAGVVYEDDCQLADVRYFRAGVDGENARVVLTITATEATRAA